MKMFQFAVNPTRLIWFTFSLFAGMLAMFVLHSSGLAMNFQTKQQEGDKKVAGQSDVKSVTDNEKKLETITFGSGCFWCTEAVFQRVKGVEKVASGYMGGKTKNPTYQEVCTGLTGHAEVIQVHYDPTVVPFADLLEIFWKTHDPTTLNRQGADEGTQYRSAVFFHTQAQKEEAEKYKAKLDEVGAFDNKIVTEITPASEFYPAEDYHQNYFNDNPRQGYCRVVIAPKLEKFEKAFKDKLKKE
jgi:peptide-methionine (S)-S-oxide reductase